MRRCCEQSKQHTRAKQANVIVLNELSQTRKKHMTPSLFIFYWNFVIHEATEAISKDTEELSFLYKDYSNNVVRINILNERINLMRSKITEAEKEIKSFQGTDEHPPRMTGQLI
jgi:hypothetical protein